MNYDYRDAAERHLEDALYLSEDSRLANADHFLGLSAECALKAVMRGLGMKLKDGMPEKSYRVHINRLWHEFQAFANYRGGAKYAGYLETTNPFDDWDVSHRYCHRNSILQGAVDNHKQGALQTKTVLDKAILDGVVQ